MTRFILTLVILSACYSASAQKGDTVRKYLNDQFKLTDKRNMVHPALAIRDNDHWYLTTNYPDSIGVLFKIYFKDKALTTYDGPRTVYHPNNIKMEEITMRDNVAQGPYHSWFKDGSQKDSGEYSSGRKNGIWKSWYASGRIESIGAYNNNQHEGEWDWYYENGNPSTKETYVKNKITRLECFDENGQPSGDHCGISKMPIPNGNFTNLDRFLQDNIRWTKEMSNALSSGTWTVKLKFTITKTGELKDVEVIESPNELFSKEATRLIQLVPKWSPSVSHNREVDYIMDYSIPFTKY
jgi:hypothetical protein